MFVSLFWVGVAVGVVGTLVVLATWAAVMSIIDRAAIRRELDRCSDARPLDAVCACGNAKDREERDSR